METARTEWEFSTEHMQYATLSHRPVTSSVKGKDKGKDLPVFNYASVALPTLYAYRPKLKCYLTHGLARWAYASIVTGLIPTRITNLILLPTANMLGSVCHHHHTTTTTTTTTVIITITFMGRIYYLSMDPVYITFIRYKRKV
jgi:hypothetical protein